MRPIRVLIVDDSVVARLMITEALVGAADLEVAGSAKNGQLALDKLEEIQPDIVVLDVEMPVLDGLRTLALLRRRDRALPVVMFSTRTSEGAAATVEALTLGASDYVHKPSAASRDETLAVLRRELVPRLVALGGPRRDRTSPPSATLAQPAGPPPSNPARLDRVDAIVLGVSTGGPNALAQLVPQLPADLAVPLLVVQHMPPVFTGLLAKRLDALTSLRVAEAQGGERPGPGEIWLAPGGRHLTVISGANGPELSLTDGPPLNGCRPAVDELFSSAVSVYGGSLLGVVMTGMGKDGLAGSRSVHDAGGQVIAQEEDSCVVYGMPRYVVDAGLADAVVPLERIADELSHRLPVRPGTLVPNRLVTGVEPT